MYAPYMYLPYVQCTYKALSRSESTAVTTRIHVQAKTLPYTLLCVCVQDTVMAIIRGP